MIKLICINYESKITLIEIFDPDAVCEICGANCAWVIEGENIGLCRKHLFESYDSIVEVSEFQGLTEIKNLF
jgi:hypothetical protein